VPSQAAPTRRRRSASRGSEPVKIDQADFATRIDNPYWPMR
jgi:hypothetical protein